MNVNCPHCGNSIQIDDVTTDEQRDVGLIYLSTKCGWCSTRIDAAGVGLDEAKRDMWNKIKERKGASPERWKIKTRKTRMGRRSRR